MSIPEKYAHIDFVPPKSVQEAAARGLAWRREYGRGGTEVGIARARDLSNGEQLSPETVMRMYQFFSRHSNNFNSHYKLDGGVPSNFRIAWDMWGGSAGKAWAEKVVKQMYAADDKEKRKKN